MFGVSGAIVYKKNREPGPLFTGRVDISAVILAQMRWYIGDKH